MSASSLICPHCSSSLNFGHAIAAGSPVECLICGATFFAEKVVAPNIPETVDAAPATIADPAPKPAPPRGKPAVGVLADTPKAKPTPRLAAVAKAASAPVPPPITRPKPSKPEPKEHKAPTSSAGRVLALVVGLGVFLLLLLGAGGTALALWLGGRNEAPPIDPSGTGPLASVKGTEPTIPPSGTSTPPLGTEPSGGKTDGPPAETKKDDGGEKKDDGEAKLVRKNRPRPGGSIDVGSVPQVAKIELKRPAIWNLDQDKIDHAIDQGVRYLRSHPWDNKQYGVGYVSLAGLTLIECGAKAKDPMVQRAAAYVRGNVAKLNHTYQMSLAILFLERLGEKRDRGIIQGLGLRLLAGQTDAGGWNYTCPTLSPPEMKQLFAFLYSHRPELPNPLPGGGKIGPNPIAKEKPLPNPVGDKRDPSDPFQVLKDLELARGIERSGDPMRNPLDDPRQRNPLEDGHQGNGSVGNPPGKDPGSKGPASGTEKKDVTKGKTESKGKTGTTTPPKGSTTKRKRPTPIPAGRLAPSLQKLPIVRNQGVGRGKFGLRSGRDDNSNTQFAMLALWAARRHDVPTEQALLLAEQRFIGSQNGNGGWGYQPRHGSTGPMTGVGLLGLAMGHGAAPTPDRKGALEDPIIQRGLSSFGGHVGIPATAPRSLPMQNLYFLWTVERVAVLYDLKTIGGKDWYGWGAQILVANQQPDGHWDSAQYHGHSAHLDTCFALLFLKRSNLVQDLTDNLRLYMAIRDPEAGSAP